MKTKTKESSILISLLKDVEEINWSTPLVKVKAINFINGLFNYFMYKHKSLNVFQHLVEQYWKNGIPGKRSHMLEIKRLLVEHNILEVKVGLNKHINKKYARTNSYKFNIKYTNQFNNNSNNSNYTLLAVPFYNELETKDLKDIENYTKSIIKDIKTDGYQKGTHHKIELIVDEIINNLIICDAETEDKDLFIEVNNDGHKVRQKYCTVLNTTKALDQLLIKLNDNYYITNNLTLLKEYKRNELIMVYTKQLFDIENNIIYSNRNETNNRLDTNLTNLKSDLWECLTLDNEELIEIDIVNSQFAILANIFKVDDLFYELSINGKLYDYIADKLKCTRKVAKGKMFRIAFDKVKKDQNEIRELFPKTMEQIDGYKKEHGYKAFSNILQKKESNIMIDNVLFKLMKKYRIVTVHDSVRVKKSDYDNVLKEMKEIFNTLNFKCTLNNKTNTEDISEPVIESNIESNTNTLEDIEESQTETETIDYVMKKQLRNSIINKLSKMYNYSMVSNLQFRPILNKVIDDAYDLIVDGKVLNENILQELLIKNK